MERTCLTCKHRVILAPFEPVERPKICYRCMYDPEKPYWEPRINDKNDENDKKKE